MRDLPQQPLAIRVRPASVGDHEAWCSLFDQLDELHRRVRPGMFQPFQPFQPTARSREQIARWLAQPDSTVLVTQIEEGVIGLVMLLTRLPSAFAGAVPRKVIEVDNLAVRADQRIHKVGRRLAA